MSIKRITIGTRGSKLSLIQTEIIKDLLLKRNPKIQIEVKVIKTTGDKNMSPIPLDSIGKGWFTKELDKELLQGTISLAVHSLKDLPEKLPDGLIISAIPEREDAREALVTNNGKVLDALSKGAVIGTDSTRRKAQILYRRPDVVVKSVRGNVNRRIEKLDNGEYDALLLAVAGLKRLNALNRITEYFDPTEFVPSPGQGALAVMTRKLDTEINGLMKEISDKKTIAIVDAERAFSAAVGGGCKMPVGAYATCQGNTLTLYGMIATLSGEHMEIEKVVGDILKPVVLGKQLAKQLLKKAPWYSSEVDA